MKTKLLVIAFIAISTIVNAQNWAAPGAIWHYSYFNGGSPWYGYVKIEKTGDTTINGKLCDVLKKTAFLHNYSTSANDTLAIGNEYTYLSGDTVYTYSNNQFYILYAFNASPGDKWTIAAPYGGTTDTVVVDSIGTTVINTTTLRCIWTSAVPASCSKYFGKIVEKIGCLDYMFPEFSCIQDANEGGQLRCYTDSSSWNYQTGIVPYCDFTTSINNHSKQKSYIGISPNPSTGQFSFSGLEKKSTISVFDITGQVIYQITASDKDQTINLGDKTKGIYFYRIMNPDNSLQKGKLIVE